MAQLQRNISDFSHLTPKDLGCDIPFQDVDYTDLVNHVCQIGGGENDIYTRYKYICDIGEKVI